MKEDRDITLHAVIHGHVQGVFFRATTRTHANTLNLNGTVKNLADGTVELCANGPLKTLEKLIEKLKAEPGKGSVSHIDIEFLNEEKKFEGFRIIY
ncbi:MAG: acylphosphatase [Chlamydiota bacterium]|nr:acylphosphatase [Chlamydiota bacterium]